MDAEARIFLQADPVGPQDRVLAGLSVAFDASCEEMWLAWRHGACLVPAPRALVRTGMDLGPWLISHGITVVSTVPTLAALWPVESLESVRLLIFGGEACPPDLAERLAVEGREVWNTYGPTEATVVACAAQLGAPGPIRIGLPLDGWDLAVVDADSLPVAEGAVGELIIGGVGLARYLDPVKDAEKYAPMPSLGWPRAYRSGDLVRYEAEGLIFQGRADEQVKLGGRRIELGEIDAALQSLPDIAGAAAAVQTTAAGNQILVGYLAAVAGRDIDLAAARELLGERLPAPLIPLLTLVDSLPTKTSGKVDRHALPWPLSGTGAAEAEGAPLNLPEDAQWIVEQWSAVLGSPVTSLDADFFAYGGGSLAAAQLVSALRVRYPTITVADIYATPRVGALVDEARQSLPEGGAVAAQERTVRPTARKSQAFQTLLGVPLHILVGMRWLTYLMAANNLLAAFAGFSAAPTISWWWVGSFLAGLRQSRRADAALRCRRPHPAAQRGAWHLSPVRAGAPPALARGTDPGPGRRHQPRQRALGALLRESARGEDRRERPAALAAARHRAADPRHRVQYRARSRSVRLVDRRRPCPHRRHPDWPRRKRGGPQHADAGSHGGCRGAGGAGFRCDRQGQGGPARGRVAGRAPWQGPALVAGLPGRAPADGPVVVRRFRRRLRHAGAHPLRLRRRRGAW